MKAQHQVQLWCDCNALISDCELIMARPNVDNALAPQIEDMYLHSWSCSQAPLHACGTEHWHLLMMAVEQLYANAQASHGHVLLTELHSS